MNQISIFVILALGACNTIGEGGREGPLDLPAMFEESRIDLPGNRRVTPCEDQRRFERCTDGTGTWGFVGGEYRRNPDDYVPTSGPEGVVWVLRPEAG